eukprot:scaffold20166_cov61-Phaeocystis_antarctica.AAC.3
MALTLPAKRVWVLAVCVPWSSCVGMKRLMHGKKRAVIVPPGSGHTHAGYVLVPEESDGLCVTRHTSHRLTTNVPHTHTHTTGLHEHRFSVHTSAAPYEERLHAAPEGTASHDERPAQQAHLPDRRVVQRQRKSFRELRHRHVHRAAWNVGAAAAACVTARACAIAKT